MTDDLSDPPVRGSREFVRYVKAQDAEVERGADASNLSKAALMRELFAGALEEMRKECDAFCGESDDATALAYLMFCYLQGRPHVSMGMLRQGRAKIIALLDGEQLRGKR